MHPAAGNWHGTVVNALLGREPGFERGLGKALRGEDLGPEGLDPLGFFRFNDLWEEASQAQQDTVPGMLETAERVLLREEEPPE